MPVDEANASDHCPPHNVCLKPLLEKTGEKEIEKKTERVRDRIHVKKEGTNEKEVEWTYCCTSASSQ